MSDIVLVHGIAQEQRSAANLEAEWLPSLAGGLENAGRTSLADRLRREVDATTTSISVRMAFYGNLFVAPDFQGVGGDGALNDDEESTAIDVAIDLLRNASESSNTRDAGEAHRALAMLSRDDADGQGIRATAVNVVAALDRIPWFSRGGITALALASRTLTQVTRYLTDPDIRTYAIKQVTRHIGPSTRAVVGHSLGSVVAYEALRSLPAGPRVPLLLTLGSPLGLSAISARLAQPPRYPDVVGRWTNVASLDDIVAARRNLESLFDQDRPPGSQFDRTWHVDNGSEPHQAGHYLTKRICGQALAGALA
ncbi:hypothetical protein EV649_5012 [Kribbella sp. VKM Ac-2569]|uniref:hypothetical protein n=1 Tax=Kribbella sp. VKM Ac-2569 TaxID=2512220 RepID=UPI00102B335F|nr:hypothetical protein [Kribbella sp. VKM Ac-2569]RZT17466.1 hypothetical protein EV649_5012 [Kribbella sp. VKM Ac-2569]